MSRGNEKQVRESVRGSLVGTSFLWWEGFVAKIVKMTLMDQALLNDGSKQRDVCSLCPRKIWWDCVKTSRI